MAAAAGVATAAAAAVAVATWSKPFAAVNAPVAMLLLPYLAASCKTNLSMFLPILGWAPHVACFFRSSLCVSLPLPLSEH